MNTDMPVKLAKYKNHFNGLITILIISLGFEATTLWNLGLITLDGYALLSGYKYMAKGLSSIFRKLQ